MSAYYEPHCTGTDYQVSVLISSAQKMMNNETQTMCYILKGIFLPTEDNAPIHENFTTSHVWITSLRWLNSQKLAGLLEKYRNPYVVLDLTSGQIEQLKTGMMTLAESSSGVVNLTYNGSDVSYKLLPSWKVRLILGHALIFTFVISFP